MSVLGGRRAAVASTVVVALTAAAVTVVAIRSDGQVVHDADLNDGGVWVTSNKDGKFAKLNKAVEQFDVGVTPNGAGLDILQDASLVLGITGSTNQLLPINPRTGLLDEASAAPIPSPQTGTALTVYVPQTADLRGGTVATVEPKTGKVWAQRLLGQQIESLGELSASAKPLATVGANAALAVDVTGGVHVVSGATGKVVSIPVDGDGFGKPVTAKVDLESRAVDITAVGTRWVVYDPSKDALWSQGADEAQAGGADVAEGGLAYAALQAPGPDAGTVGLQDQSALHLVGLDGDSGGDAVEIAQDPAEGIVRQVTRPVRLGACLHAAWSDATQVFYGANCGQDQTVPAVTLLDEGDISRKDGVRLRTNRDLIVLNDLDTGAVWDLDSKPVKIDNWEDLTPPLKADNKDTKNQNLIDEASLPQPPKAVPDNLRVRPGRTSKLHVLDNDTDSKGSILAIAPSDVSVPSLQGVTASVAADGQSIDVAVPADPDGSAFTFTYQVNNGTAAKKSQAKVTVTLVDSGTNTPPRLRPGTARLADTTYPIVQNGRLPVQVVGDWRDQESDALAAESVEEGSSVDGLGRLNIEAGNAKGSRTAEYAVTDGMGGRTVGRVSLVVLGDGDQVRKPQTQPDVVRGIVGKPLQIEPLGNDIPGADPDDPEARMRLSSEVRSTGSLRADTNLDTGVVTLTGVTAGVFELAYGAQVGAGVSSGRIRVDMEADADQDAPPVAVPDSATVRDQTPVLADVLANDYSPRADVLVTQSVTVSSDNAWLRPSIYKGRWVRVEALDPLQGTSRTGSVKYTISDGTKSATGEVSVTQKPALEALPIVEDDTAVVRAQDTVTINALDNDSMAEGIPLVLLPDSVKVLGAGAKQTAFASGNVIRYVPDERNPTEPLTRTIEYAVYPIGMREKAQTGRITVTIKPLPSKAQPNLPPVARSFSASVVAGETLPITIPTSGVDPDGDTVTVLGIQGEDAETIELNLGRVTSFGAATITYEAYPTTSGTEVLNYLVTDRFGATSTGFIRIGVVPPADPQPPVAVEDEVRAAPGKTVTIDVTENDLIARGDSISLEYKEINDADELKDWKVDESLTQFQTKAPDQGVRQLTYGITNGLFDPSRSSVAVVAVPGFNNPPVAVDDVAKPQGEETSTLVDALANDRDIDSAPGTLKIVSVLSPEGTVEDGKVRVKVLDHPHTVPYVIEDEDGARAMALIYVPTGSNGAPFVVSAALISMDQDSSKTVEIGDYVKSPRARVVGVTSGDTISASPSRNLRVELSGRDSLKLTSTGGYNGPGAVLLEVTDQESADQKDFGTAYVSIPVQIGPKVPLLRCPDYAVTLTAAGRAREFDIPTLCRAWLPQGLSLDDVAFRASWATEPDGVELDVTGRGNRNVSLQADRDAPSSTDGRLEISARGSNQKASTVRVRVLGLPDGQTDQANAANDPAAAPPPRVRPFSVANLKAGDSATVNLRSYLDSPLEEPKCSVTGATIASGKGLTVRPSGCQIVITASKEASGQGTIDVTVSDGPGRVAPGRGTVTLLGFPGVPRSVGAVADRVNGGSARVSFSPPAYDGGAPITGYHVRWTGGSTGEQTCTASPCTISGLTDGEPYTFTVAAVNSVGEGDPSARTAPVTPDTKPNAVNGVRMVSRGDRTLTIGWTAPAKKGSDITRYIVRVTDTQSGAVKQVQVPAPGLQTTVNGLVNNNVQQVQVRAANGAGPGPFGAAVQMQSAGTPAAVPAPEIAPRAPGTFTQNQVQVSWQTTDPNGPPLTGFTVYRRTGGGGWAQIGSTDANVRTFTDNIDYDGQTYSYVVTATNGGGNESPKSNATNYQSVAPPLTPDAPRVNTANPDYQAQVTVNLSDSRGAGYTQLQWQTSGGYSGNVACGCAENSATSFTTGNLGTSPQTMQVRVYNGVSWSPWSASGNQFRTFGPTLTPNGFTTGRDGNDPRWAWSLRTNGRAIDQVQWSGSFDGTGGGSRESFQGNGQAGKTYRLRVRAHAPDSGWSPWTDYKDVTIPDPPPPPPSDPITNVGKGSKKSDCGNCYDVVWSAPGVPNGTYSMSCSRPGNTFYTGTVTVSGGRRTSGYCSLDPNLSNQVQITLRGGGKTYSSGMVRWA